MATPEFLRIGPPRHAYVYKHMGDGTYLCSRGEHPDHSGAPLELRCETGTWKAGPGQRVLFSSTDSILDAGWHTWQLGGHPTMGVCRNVFMGACAFSPTTPSAYPINAHPFSPSPLFPPRPGMAGWVGRASWSGTRSICAYTYFCIWLRLGTRQAYGQQVPGVFRRRPFI